MKQKIFLKWQITTTPVIINPSSGIMSTAHIAAE